MLREHTPPERINAEVTRLQIRVAAAGMPLLGSYERAIFFLLVLRQSLTAQCSAPCRPISMLAIATSLRRPYATVWRRVHSLVGDGFLAIEARSVTMAAGVVESPAVHAFLRTITASFRAMLHALARDGAINASVNADLSHDRLLVGAIDLLLCTVESECRSDWIDLLLIGYVEGRHSTRDENSGDFLTEDSLNLRRMAQDLGLPYSTVHRRTCAMIDKGTLERRGKAVVVAPGWISDGPGAVRTSTAIDCARRVFHRLSAGWTGYQC